MKKDFIEYIKNEFNFSENEIILFEQSLWKKLKKSIRINTNKISVDNFLNIIKKTNWELEQTCLWENIFYINNNSELNLWNSHIHIAWYFYVQELAASSAPFYLSNDIISEEKYLILDMSASPWWKTTQLSEYYPNSLIIANELNKQRLKWFFSNLDRMSSLNVACTNYDWRFFKNIPETFDKIILDAPCSWEWTSYKTWDSALKYWNIKNIRTIAKLQFSLLEASIISLKVWWEMTYSTCTLNSIENEWVIDKIIKKYWEHLNIIKIWNSNYSYKKNWPHIDETWWFFVAKIKKISSLDKKEKIKEIKQNIEKLSFAEEKMIESFFQNYFWFSIKPYYLYKYNNNIHLWNKNLNNIWNTLFLFKIWINIWEIKNNSFQPTFYAWIFKEFNKNIIDIDIKLLDELYKGKEKETKEKDWFYQLKQDWLLAWIAKIKKWKIKSLINTWLIRK